jgi:hypothetical protein
MSIQILNLKHPADKALVAKARREGRYVPIHRPHFWGNQFVVGRDGTRAEVIAKYRAHLARRLSANPGLIDRLLALEGKVLGCWCVPDP